MSTPDALPDPAAPAPGPDPVPAPLLANMHAYWTAFGAARPGPATGLAGPRGLVWWLSGIPDPQLNGVLRADLGVDDVTGTVSAVRDEATSVGVPLVWWVGSDSAPRDLSSRLAAAGLPVVGRVVLMATDLNELPEEPPPGELTVRPVVDHDELPGWADVVATAFHLAEDGVAGYREFETRRPAGSGYLRFGGWVAGELVATAALLVTAGVAGVYTVATLPSHARRGYGRALTLAAFAEGRRQGATVGTLQATEAGHPVYRRLGMRDLDSYALHLVDPAS